VENFMDLPNIGKVNAGKLVASGITTVEEFMNIGAKEAFIKIRQSTDPGLCMSALLALAGAEMGIKKKELPEDIVADLREFFGSVTIKN